MLFITGCSCDEQYLCPPLSPEGIEWINKMHAFGDTIEYQNNLGETIQFQFETTEISSSELKNACHQEIFSCHCDRECFTYGNLIYQPDSSDPKKLYFRYAIDEIIYNESVSSKNYSYTIYDLRGNINNYFSPSETDSFYTSIDIEGIIYNNVYVFSVDTNLSYYTNQKVWKSYISIDDGIIAFWKRPSNLIFVRQ